MMKIYGVVRSEEVDYGGVMEDKYQFFDTKEKAFDCFVKMAHDEWERECARHTSMETKNKGKWKKEHPLTEEEMDGYKKEWDEFNEAYDTFERERDKTVYFVANQYISVEMFIVNVQ